MHDTAKAEKDLRQAATLIAVLVERDDMHCDDCCRAAERCTPRGSSALPSLCNLLAPHTQALDEKEQALAVH